MFRQFRPIALIAVMDCQPLKYRDPFKKLTKGGCQAPSPTPSGCWWENFLKKNKPSARATSGPQHSRSLCVCMWANDTAAKVSFVSINYNTPSLCSFFSTSFSSAAAACLWQPQSGWLSAAPGEWGIRIDNSRVLQMEVVV